MPISMSYALEFYDFLVENKESNDPEIVNTFFAKLDDFFKYVLSEEDDIFEDDDVLPFLLETLFPLLTDLMNRHEKYQNYLKFFNFLAKISATQLMLTEVQYLKYLIKFSESFLTRPQNDFTQNLCEMNDYSYNEDPENCIFVDPLSYEATSYCIGLQLIGASGLLEQMIYFIFGSDDEKSIEEFISFYYLFNSKLVEEARVYFGTYILENYGPIDEIPDNKKVFAFLFLRSVLSDDDCSNFLRSILHKNLVSERKFENIIPLINDLLSNEQNRNIYEVFASFTADLISSLEPHLYDELFISLMSELQKYNVVDPMNVSKGLINNKYAILLLEKDVKESTPNSIKYLFENIEFTPSVSSLFLTIMTERSDVSFNNLGEIFFRVFCNFDGNAKIALNKLIEEKGETIKEGIANAINIFLDKQHDSMSCNPYILIVIAQLITKLDIDSYDNEKFEEIVFNNLQSTEITKLLQTFGDKIRISQPSQLVEIVEPSATLYAALEKGTDEYEDDVVEFLLKQDETSEQFISLLIKVYEFTLDPRVIWMALKNGLVNNVLTDESIELVKDRIRENPSEFLDNLDGKYGVLLAKSAGLFDLSGIDASEICERSEDNNLIAIMFNSMKDKFSLVYDEDLSDDLTISEYGKKSVIMESALANAGQEWWDMMGNICDLFDLNLEESDLNEENLPFISVLVENCAKCIEKIDGIMSPEFAQKVFIIGAKTNNTYLAEKAVETFEISDSVVSAAVESSNTKFIELIADIISDDEELKAVALEKSLENAFIYLLESPLNYNIMALIHKSLQIDDSSFSNVVEHIFNKIPDNDKETIKYLLNLICSLKLSDAKRNALIRNVVTKASNADIFIGFLENHKFAEFSEIKAIPNPSSHISHIATSVLNVMSCFPFIFKDLISKKEKTFSHDLGKCLINLSLSKSKTVDVESLAKNPVFREERFDKMFRMILSQIPANVSFDFRQELLKKKATSESLDASLITELFTKIKISQDSTFEESIKSMQEDTTIDSSQQALFYYLADKPIPITQLYYTTPPKVLAFELDDQNTTCSFGYTVNTTLEHPFITPKTTYSLCCYVAIDMIKHEYVTYIQKDKCLIRCSTEECTYVSSTNKDDSVKYVFMINKESLVKSQEFVDQVEPCENAVLSMILHNETLDIESLAKGSSAGRLAQYLFTDFYEYRLFELLLKDQQFVDEYLVSTILFFEDSVPSKDQMNEILAALPSITDSGAIASIICEWLNNKEKETFVISILTQLQLDSDQITSIVELLPEDIKTDEASLAFSKKALSILSVEEATELVKNNKPFMRICLMNSEKPEIFYPPTEEIMKEAVKLSTPSFVASLLGNSPKKEAVVIAAPKLVHDQGTRDIFGSIIKNALDSSELDFVGNMLVSDDKETGEFVSDLIKNHFSLDSQNSKECIDIISSAFKFASQPESFSLLFELIEYYSAWTKESSAIAQGIASFIVSISPTNYDTLPQAIKLAENTVIPPDEWFKDGIKLFFDNKELMKHFEALDMAISAFLNYFLKKFDIITMFEKEDFVKFINLTHTRSVKERLFVQQIQEIISSFSPEFLVHNSHVLFAFSVFGDIYANCLLTICNEDWFANSPLLYFIAFHPVCMENFPVTFSQDEELWLKSFESFKTIIKKGIEPDELFAKHFETTCKDKLFDVLKNYYKVDKSVLQNLFKFLRYVVRLFPSLADEFSKRIDEDGFDRIIGMQMMQKYIAKFVAATAETAIKHKTQYYDKEMYVIKCYLTIFSFEIKLCYDNIRPFIKLMFKINETNPDISSNVFSTYLDILSFFKIVPEKRFEELKKFAEIGIIANPGNFSNASLEDLIDLISPQRPIFIDICQFIVDKFKDKVDGNVPSYLDHLSEKVSDDASYNEKVEALRKSLESIGENDQENDE